MKFLIKNKKVFKGIIEVLIGCCCVGEVASLLLDKESVIELLKTHKKCFALEEHNVIGGLYSAIAAFNEFFSALSLSCSIPCKRRKVI